jgi:hypothetical protein
VRALLAGWRTEALIAAAVVALFVIGRSLVFVLFEQAQFDADQAITGLMAKHIAERRAFPFYAYGVSYMLTIESWIAAPFLALFGTSVAALRVPLVLVNLTAAALLVWLIARELQLRPLLAIVPALFFVAAPPTLTSDLLTAVGGNSEVFVYVLLLWLFRDRPILFGLVFLVGFLNREFTAYALSALVAIEALQGRLWQRDNVTRKTIALVVFAAGWEVAQLLRMRADAFGPGTVPGFHDGSISNAAVAAGFLCADLEWGRISANLVSLATTQMGTLTGAMPVELSAINVNSSTGQGAAWLWPAFCVAMLAALARLGWLGWHAQRGTADSRRLRKGASFALYLFLIGLQAGVVWAVSRCDALSTMTIRYALLLVLVPVAIVGLHLALEHRGAWRALTIGFVLVWTAVSIQGHAALLARYLSAAPPPNAYRDLTDELAARGIRYVWSDYWTAYMIDFLTDERIIATPTDRRRIEEYEAIVRRHESEAVLVSRQPCPDGQPLSHWYLCRSR